MRVAAIYDIHGNLPALEAVMEEIRRASVDRVMVGGDVIPGPMPCETLRYLQDLDIPTSFIYGNCEAAVLEQLQGGEVAKIPEAFRPIMRWTAEKLSPESQKLIASWPRILRLDVPELGRVLFCHGTPRDADEAFTRLTGEDRLVPIFENLEADLVVCGHTHMQFDRIIGSTRVVNAGSVGMPFGDTGAFWLLLGPDIQLRRTIYDLDRAAERIRATDYPQDFAAQILKPPSEEQMLAMLS